MKSIDIKFIADVEKMTESEIKEALTTQTEAHKVSCVNWNDYPYAPEVQINMAYSDKALAILFRVKEEHVLGNTLENNGPVWEDSCVETFIKDPVGEGYYNIEVNCIATKLAAHRLSRTDFELFNESRLSEMNVKAKLAAALEPGEYMLKVYTRSGMGEEFGVKCATRKVTIA